MRKGFFPSSQRQRELFLLFFVFSMVFGDWVISEYFG